MCGIPNCTHFEMLLHTRFTPVSSTPTSSTGHPEIRNDSWKRELPFPRLVSNFWMSCRGNGNSTPHTLYGFFHTHRISPCAVLRKLTQGSMEAFTRRKVDACLRFIRLPIEF